MDEPENIIIGAGLSGLSCGWALKDCLLLERDCSIGGLAKTLQYKGFKFDLGGHRFFTYNAPIENFFRSLFKDEILEVERKSKIYRRGKFIKYPLKVSVIFQLNPWAITSSFFTYIHRKIKPLNEFSFKERAINRFGDHLYKLFFRDYTQKVWGINCDNISKEVVDIRLQNVSLMRAIKYAVIKDNNTKSFANKFLYPKEGIGKISEALSKGLDIRLNSKVTGLVESGGRIEKVIVNNSEEFPCSNLVSTMPVTKLVKFFNPPAEVEKAAQDLRYRSLVFVFLVLKKPNYTKNQWIYFPDSQIFGRLHEPKNWSCYMAPKNKTGVGVEIFCDKEDGVWKMGDTAIAHRVIRDLPLSENFEIEDHFVIKVEDAYPLYDTEYKVNLDKIKGFLSSYKNLFLLGRVGSFKYINMDSCLEEGLRLGYFLGCVEDEEF